MAFALRQNFAKKFCKTLQRVENNHRLQVRFLNLHEFRAKELMARHNVRVQRGILASTPAEAKKMPLN